MAMVGIMSVLMVIHIIVKILLIQISAGILNSPETEFSNIARNVHIGGYINIDNPDQYFCGFLFSIARHNIYI